MHLFVYKMHERKHFIDAKSIAFYPYFGRNINREYRCQSRDKMLYILLAEICIVPSYDDS